MIAKQDPTPFCRLREDGSDYLIGICTVAFGDRMEINMEIIINAATEEATESICSRDDCARDR